MFWAIREIYRGTAAPRLRGGVDEIDDPAANRTAAHVRPPAAA